MKALIGITLLTAVSMYAPLIAVAALILWIVVFVAVMARDDMRDRARCKRDGVCLTCRGEGWVHGGDYPRTKPCGDCADTSGWVLLPEDVVRYNGGQRCDMEKGPCACGAWH